MDAHRLADPTSFATHDLRGSFSCFDFVDEHFRAFPNQRLSGIPAARRIFSLARSFDAETLVVEDITPCGLVQDEIDEIAALYPDYAPAGLQRLSFWRKAFRTPRGLDSADDGDLIGYAILKRDVVPTTPDRSEWHVFEAVFPKYDHRHNCVPCPKSHAVAVGQERFSIPGLLYCQQNRLNKACAHVALRSLLTRMLPEGDIAYSRMNMIAAQGHGQHAPSDGLTPQQMRRILTTCGVTFSDVDYEQEEKKNPTVRTDVPFQKYLYAGIESGFGGLLGFSMSGPQADESKHIIPFFGHTFNKDTWAPDADVAYFNIGGGVGYVPSSSWTSSFIGHDDNFGANFCVPRLYASPQQVQYVVELRGANTEYGGLIAEAQALQFLYSVGGDLDQTNPWSRRLAYYAHPAVQRVILRAVGVDRETYVRHLTDIRDWQGHREIRALPQALADFLPDLLWVVEVSLPQLFPANERKVGEIVLNAGRPRDETKDPSAEIDYGLFLMARLPGEYILLRAVNQYGPSFSVVRSRLKSHVELLRLEGSIV